MVSGRTFPTKSHSPPRSKSSPNPEMNAAWCERANYPFERSRRFLEIKPDSGHGDYSRLSCGPGNMQLGPSASIPRASSRTRWSSICTQMESAEGDDSAQAIAGGSKEVAD